MDKERLEDLYLAYNRPEYVHPDPLEFLYRYQGLRDREIVALIASSLAYGRVVQILRSVSAVLDRMGPSPFVFVTHVLESDLYGLFRDFKHRFTTGAELAALLIGLRGVIEEYGSIYGCFLKGLSEEDDTVLPALSFFIRAVRACGLKGKNSLVSDPSKGSACKRLNLFLRWMVRQDGVDPGGWEAVSPSRLIVPLDTHMHRIGRFLGCTDRNQADMRTALNMTEAFRGVVPEDPVRYDFVLTRLGIRRDMDMEACLKIPHRAA